MRTAEEWLKDIKFSLPGHGSGEPYHHTERVIWEIQEDAFHAATEKAARICDRSEDECKEDPMCHAHDACEIRILITGRLHPDTARDG